MVLQVEAKLDVMTSSSMPPFLISGEKKAVFIFLCMMLSRPRCSLWVLYQQARLGVEKCLRCCTGPLICNAELSEHFRICLNG